MRLADTNTSLPTLRLLDEDCKDTALTDARLLEAWASWPS